MKRLIAILLILLSFSIPSSTAVFASGNIDAAPRYMDVNSLLTADADADESIPLTPEERRNAHIITAAISIALGFIIPGITVGIWTRQLKSVRPVDTASNYIRTGSLSLRVQRDIFLYRNVTKIPRAQSSGGSKGSRRF